MRNLYLTLYALTVVLLFSSCAVQHQHIPELNLTHFNSYRTNQTDALQYGYFENLLQHANNKRLIRWAKRKNYQVVGFYVINTSDEFRKGFQLKFYHNNQRLKLIRNEWVAKKSRQKGGGAHLAAIPFIIAESALLNSDDDDDYSISHQTLEEEAPFTMAFVDANEKVRKRANKDLLDNLVDHDISHQVLPFGIPIYGIIIIDDSVPINNIEVRL